MLRRLTTEEKDLMDRLLNRFGPEAQNELRGALLTLKPGEYREVHVKGDAVAQALLDSLYQLRAKQHGAPASRVEVR